MIKKSKIKSKQIHGPQLDGVFVLKLIVYGVLGSLWLKLDSSTLQSTFPIPVGLAIGLLIASHEHFQIDRKVEYAVLILSALVGLIAPYGLFIQL